MVSWLETFHRTHWKYPPKISNLAGAACYNHDPEHRRKFVWSSGNQFCFCLLPGLKVVYDIIDICPNMPLAGPKHYNQPPNWQNIHICKSYLTYYIYIYFVFVFIHEWTVYSVWTVHNFMVYSILLSKDKFGSGVPRTGVDQHRTNVITHLIGKIYGPPRDLPRSILYGNCHGSVQIQCNQIQTYPNTRYLYQWVIFVASLCLTNSSLLNSMWRNEPQFKVK